MSQPVPMYRQIAEDLRRRIEHGLLPGQQPPDALPPGSQLPSEMELREDYGQDKRVVSRNTVRDAIQLLISRGLIETRPGQGTFVLRKMVPFVNTLNVDPRSSGEDETFKSEAERRGRTPESTRPRVEVQPATHLVARQLELDPGAQVISRHQERRIDGTPWSMQTTFYPMELVTEQGATDLLVAEGIKDGVIAYLRGRLGINQVGWRDAILARPPDGNERTFFELSDKVQVAIFEFRRTGYDEDGKPIRFTVTVFPADRNLFELVVGDVPAPPPAGGGVDAGVKNRSG